MGRVRTVVVMVAMVALLALPAAAGATVVTRHQNSHYRVTASLTPTQVAVGQRLTIAFTVTNTTDYAHRVSIQYEFDGPSFGQGAAMSPILLKPHTSWSTTFTHRAPVAGGYSAIVKATDAAGTSHAKATATAS
jgi:hypothetical protein